MSESIKKEPKLFSAYFDECMTKYNNNNKGMIFFFLRKLHPLVLSIFKVTVTQYNRGKSCKENK